jgi:hypothetical protein
MQLTKYLMPADAPPGVVFPWVPGDLYGTVELLACAQHYGIPLPRHYHSNWDVRIVTDGTRWGCAHRVTDPDARTGIGSGRPVVCDECQAVLDVLDHWAPAVDAAGALAHFLAWYRIARNDAAIRMLAVTLGNVLLVTDASLIDAGLYQAVQDAIDAHGPVGDLTEVWLTATAVTGDIETRAVTLRCHLMGATAEQTTAAAQWFGHDIGPVEVVASSPDRDRDDWSDWGDWEDDSATPAPLAGFLVFTSGSRRGLGLDWYPLGQVVPDPSDLLVATFGPDGIVAVPGELAVMTRALRGANVLNGRRFLPLIGPVTHDPATVAALASKLWEAATPDTCMAAPDDCIIVADTVCGDATATEIALGLTPEWTLPGTRLAEVARSLAAR